MRLLVVHYHWRPGGVRQVVENGLPAVVAQRELGVREVVLAAGEAPPAEWAARMTQAIQQGWEATASPDSSHPAPSFRFVTEPALGYAAEWSGCARAQRQRLEDVATAWLAENSEPTTVWLQNPAVGRNLGVAAAFHAACAKTGALLVCHHHDFFFDNRWDHWPAIHRAGWTSFNEALHAAVPRGRVLHRVVSPHDEEWLQAWTGDDLAPAAGSRLWPNPVRPLRHQQRERAGQGSDTARRWGQQRFGTDATVWLVPARGMRRKNLLESLLLARWQAPEAVVAVTGGASSPAESTYLQTIIEAAQEQGWPLHVGVLADASPSAPTMAEVLPLAARVVVSSLFEGFGLVAHEARAADVPVWLRRDACSGPWPAGADVYDEIAVSRALLDVDAELARQRARWHALRSRLPTEIQRLWTEPATWNDSGPWPFSRLTLGGQLEVLRHSHAQLADGLELIGHQKVDSAPNTTLDDYAAEAFGHRVATDLLAAWQTQPPEAVMPLSSLPAVLLARLNRFQHYPLLWPRGYR